MAKIYVNGDAQEVNLPLNVSELIKQLLVENPEMVSVQVNEEFAEREDWDSIQLKEGDKVDFLYFMGGGQILDNCTIRRLDDCIIDGKMK
jgi:sulfur carrier protein